MSASLRKLLHRRIRKMGAAICWPPGLDAITCGPFHNRHYIHRQDRTNPQVPRSPNGHFPSSAVFAPVASLRCEGEDHPADDEIEQEDGVHGQGLPIWGLTVCQEGCGG